MLIQGKNSAESTGISATSALFASTDSEQLSSKLSSNEELTVGLGGLGVTCSTRDPRLAVSNLAEVDGFFQDVKILSTSPPGGTLSWESRF